MQRLSKVEPKSPKHPIGNAAHWVIPEKVPPRPTSNAKTLRFRGVRPTSRNILAI
jgi:hypothetical protein